MKRSFLKSSRKIYKLISNPFTVVFVLLVIAVWFMLGIFLHFDEVWYRYLEGFIIILTLFMAFVIEHNQHADTKRFMTSSMSLLKACRKLIIKK